MLLAAAVAIWKGWQIHRGELAIMAYGLGVLALAMGIWHLTRKDPAPSALTGQFLIHFRRVTNWDYNSGNLRLWNPLPSYWSWFLSR